MIICFILSLYGKYIQQVIFIRLPACKTRFSLMFDRPGFAAINKRTPLY
ncbi:hypothetical protein DCCM_3908 [Desulfocucumis palustris]|uniref:Uncharacterized protein n=1 Tax=Desulfocucumis palustris TaxID=1898651 RepID=A0A2L2XEW9_9FIRM|nr:hypothetical protein DCCM_3908 [Desulfocucumis palustris]